MRALGNYGNGDMGVAKFFLKNFICKFMKGNQKMVIQRSVGIFFKIFDNDDIGLSSRSARPICTSQYAL